MIHAMVWALVLTSGAGMSFSGPMRSTSGGREAAGEALEFAAGDILGSTAHAALAAAEGDVDDGALPGHPRGQRLTSST